MPRALAAAVALEWFADVINMVVGKRSALCVCILPAIVIGAISFVRWVSSSVHQRCKQRTPTRVNIYMASTLYF